MDERPIPSYLGKVLVYVLYDRDRSLGSLLQNSARRFSDAKSQSNSLISKIALNSSILTVFFNIKKIICLERPSTHSRVK